MDLNSLSRACFSVAISIASTSCAWYRSDLHVAFDPHSKPSTIASTTFKLGWEGGFSVDRASLIYVGERFKDGDGHLKLQIIDGADRLSGVRVYEARVRRSGPSGEWKVFAENLSFAADQPIRIPLELYTARAPYQLRIRGAFVTRSGALKSFVLDDQITMERDRQLRSMWDAMAF